MEINSNQARAKNKRIDVNVRHVSRDGVVPALGRRVYEEHSLRLVEQDAIPTAVDGVGRAHIYRSQARATNHRERTRKTAPNVDVGQAGTVEQRSSHRDHTVRDGEVDQAATVKER